MRMRRSARFLSLFLVVVILIPLLLASCQAAEPTQVGVQEEVTQVQTTAPSPTLAPPPTLPPTWTPTPGKPTQPATQISASATPTATFNVPQTVAAQATTVAAIKCEKHADSWQINVQPSWRDHWCEVRGRGGKFYEYQVAYPESWKVITFGELTPNLYFNTGQQNVDLRLFQLYNYVYRSYTGSLEEAPVKAAICDDKDKCTLVIEPHEKITQKAVAQIGGKEVMVVDSTNGNRSIRRYFFFVGFRYARPKSNRLFVFRLETPEPVTDATYADLHKQIGDMIVSVKPDL